MPVRQFGPPAGCCQRRSGPHWPDRYSTAILSAAAALSLLAVGEQQAAPRRLLGQVRRHLFAPGHPATRKVRGAPRVDRLQAPQGVTPGFCRRARGLDDHVHAVVVRDQREAVVGPQHPEGLRHGHTGQANLAAAHRARTVEDERDVHRRPNRRPRRLGSGQRQQEVSGHRRAGGNDGNISAERRQRVVTHAQSVRRHHDRVGHCVFGGGACGGRCLHRSPAASKASIGWCSRGSRRRLRRPGMTPPVTAPGYTPRRPWTIALVHGTSTVLVSVL